MDRRTSTSRKSSTKEASKAPPYGQLFSVCFRHVIYKSGYQVPVKSVLACVVDIPHSELCSIDLGATLAEFEFWAYLRRFLTSNIDR